MPSEARGSINFDLALEKRTYLTEQVQLNFRAEFFNVLNHTEWAAPYLQPRSILRCSVRLRPRIIRASAN